MKVVRVWGKYAVRRFSFSKFTYVYLDLEDPRYWWAKNTKYFPSCLTSDVDRVAAIAKKEQVISL